MSVVAAAVLRGPDGVPVATVAAVAEIVWPDATTSVIMVREQSGAQGLDHGGVATRVVIGSAAGFEATAHWSPATTSGRREVHLLVRWSGGSTTRAAVRVRAHLPATAQTPWWLIPGAFYGENRPEDCQRRFPRFAVGANDPSGMISDHWSFRADRAASPAVFAWAGAGGVALVTDERTTVGMTGLGLAHDASTGCGSVFLTFPFQEEPVTYDGSSVPLPAQRTFHTWSPGEEVELHLAVYALGGDRHSYAGVLREEHARLAPTAPLRPWVSVAQAATLAAEGLVRWHYAEPGVLIETAGFDRSVTGRDGLSVDRQAMHVGWVSGLPWAYALLTHGRRTGDRTAATAAERVIDTICATLSPSGTFWGIWHREQGWSKSWSPMAHSLHSRTLAEAATFLLRALELGEDLRERQSWRHALRSNLDVVVARQRHDGNLGSAHSAMTGQVLSWAGTAGLMWVVALAEAQRWDTPDGAYLKAAERAGHYYAQFVEDEYLFGAPEDVDVAPSSEDGYVAVMAYTALHRRTGAARWLDLAQQAADWSLTFRYTYDVTFEPHTILAHYDFGTRGADTASSCNQHLHAYGLICWAEMCELTEKTGDSHYRERAQESLACFRQFIARCDGDFNARRGMVTERYYQTACFGPKGSLLTLSHAWSVGVLLLACEQAMETTGPRVDPAPGH